MPGFRRLLTLVLLLGAVGACSEIQSPDIAAEVPTTYQLEFFDPGPLSRKVELRAVVTLHGPQEMFLHLVGSPGEPAGNAAAAWAGELNRRFPGLAESEGNHLLIHRVLKMEFEAPHTGLRITPVGPTP